MGEVKVWSHKVSLTFYRLTSISFHVNQPSHSSNTAFSRVDLEDLRSRSWVRGMLKVTTWVQHSIDSHPFHSMSIGHPIPEIQLFQNLTLKIQGQGHGWSQSWKSQSGCSSLSTHIPLVPCQSALPFLRYSIFQIWPWKSKVKVMGEGKVESHNMGPTFYWLTSLSFHVNRPSHSWDTTFFYILPWKSKVKVMVEVKVESQKLGVTSYRITSLSFHVNRPFHSWDTAFSKFDHENPRSRSNDHGVAQVQV